MTLYHFDTMSAVNSILIFIIFLSIPLSGISIDIYVPSLPAVSQYFLVDAGSAQLTITAFLIGFGVAQLFIGSIADSIGRKKPFIIATIIFILSTLLIPFSHTINQLLLLRLIQGFFVAGVNVPMRAAISDLYTGKKFHKMVNYMTIAWTIGPIIAPAVGGYLQHYFGWKASFYLLALYGTIILVLNLLFMPETLREKKSFRLIDIISSYRKILFHIDFVMGIILLGLAFSIFILFGVVCPFLIQSILHYSAIDFGRVALLMGLALFLGNTTNRLLIEIDSIKKVKICYWLMLITAMIMLIIALFGVINMYVIVIPIFMIIYFSGIIFPNYFARNLALFPQHSASANALTGGFLILLSAVVSAYGTLLQSNNQYPLALTYVIITIISLLIVYFETRRKKLD